MCLGKKAATTRLLEGPDELTGVSRPGALCIGEVGTRGFGILGIRRVLDMCFSDVDDALAKNEDMQVTLLAATKFRIIHRLFFNWHRTSTLQVPKSHSMLCTLFE